MLRHYVVFTFEENFFTDDNYEEYVKAFDIIKNSYEGILDVSIHKNVIDRPANMDLMIIMDLKDETVLSEYLNHEEHVRMGQKYNPHVTNRISFDYYI